MHSPVTGLAGGNSAQERRGDGVGQLLPNVGVSCELGFGTGRTGCSRFDGGIESADLVGSQLGVDVLDIILLETGFDLAGGLADDLVELVPLHNVDLFDGRADDPKTGARSAGLRLRDPEEVRTERNVSDADKLAGGEGDRIVAYGEVSRQVHDEDNISSSKLVLMLRRGLLVRAGGDIEKLDGCQRRGLIVVGDGVGVHGDLLRQGGVDRLVYVQRAERMGAGDADGFAGWSSSGDGRVGLWQARVFEKGGPERGVDGGAGGHFFADGGSGPHYRPNLD